MGWQTSPGKNRIDNGSTNVQLGKDRIKQLKSFRHRGKIWAKLEEYIVISFLYILKVPDDWLCEIPACLYDQGYWSN